MKDRDTVFKAIRNVIAMNRDKVSYVQRENSDYFISPFAYE